MYCSSASMSASVSLNCGILAPLASASSARPIESLASIWVVFFIHGRNHVSLRRPATLARSGPAIFLPIPWHPPQPFLPHTVFPRAASAGSTPEERAAGAGVAAGGVAAAGAAGGATTGGAASMRVVLQP